MRCSPAGARRAPSRFRPSAHREHRSRPPPRRPGAYTGPPRSYAGRCSHRPSRSCRIRDRGRNVEAAAPVHGHEGLNGGVRVEQGSDDEGALPGSALKGQCCLGQVRRHGAVCEDRPFRAARRSARIHLVGVTRPRDRAGRWRGTMAAHTLAPASFISSIHCDGRRRKLRGTGTTAAFEPAKYIRA
jgi:hypothetical protein